MKSDSSIKNITIASINRSIMNPESWLHSRICLSNQTHDFSLNENEFAIFEISTSRAKTLITTQRILEKTKDNLKIINFDEIDDVVFGDFKKQIDKPEISIFRITDMFGDEIDFQMETGKASIGLIKAINTVRKLRASH